MNACQWQSLSCEKETTIYHTWGGRLTKDNIAGIRPQGKESIKLEIPIRPAGNNDSGYDINWSLSKP
jgi:hypothetical protein